MQKQFVIENGNFIFSKDENNFNEVLDSFKFANEIIITTYNISKNDDSLIQSLKNLNQNQHVKLFTNIPNRFNSYFKNYHKNQAKKLIDNYIKKLDPTSFNCNIEVYFSFSNHSKIIATDSVAYIGSANFSSESKKNFEVGVLFKDGNFMNYLNNEVLPELIENSLEYYLEMEVKEIALAYDCLETIKELSVELSESFYMPIEVNGRIISKSFRLNFLGGLSYIIDGLQNNLCEIDQHLNSFFMNMEVREEDEDYYIEAETILSSLNINDILELIDEESDLYKYINSSEEKFIEDAIQSLMEEYGEINPDSLNDNAYKMLGEFLDDQKEEVVEELLMFENQINNLYDSIQKILNLLPIYIKTNRILNPKIDNTK